MEFTIKRDYFITQLNDTLKAISPRTTLPILTGIKIDAKDNNVILTGSDSEISIEITIPKQVDGEDIVDITETDQWFFLVVSLLTSLKITRQRC